MTRGVRRLAASLKNLILHQKQQRKKWEKILASHVVEPLHVVVTAQLSHRHLYAKMWRLWFILVTVDGREGSSRIGSWNIVCVIELLVWGNGALWRHFVFYLLSLVCIVLQRSCFWACPFLRTFRSPFFSVARLSCIFFPLGCRKKSNMQKLCWQNQYRDLGLKRKMRIENRPKEEVYSAHK